MFLGLNMYFRYGPRKVEIISRDPYIAIMHQFISNGESEEIIKKTGPSLKRSLTWVSKEEGVLGVSDSRVSEQMWLHEGMSIAAQRITSRLDGFLDVKAKSKSHSEAYQGFT